MTHANRLHFQDTPGLLSQYSRALFARGNGQKTPVLPATEAWLTGVRPAAEKVRAYARVCGYPSDSSLLPLTYPHILAFPLHMELMLQKDFPLPLMGLVHIRNRITQFRALRLEEKLDIRCSFDGLHTTDKGLEFDIRTEVSCGGELVWESVSTNLSRRATGSKRSDKRIPLPAAFSQRERWDLPANLGRQYARVSGDSNPIHLFALTARLFGFPRHIAHGMWSKARAAATLYPQLQSERCVLTTEFKLPVYLPGKAELNWNVPDDETPAGTDFELRSLNGEKTHIKGRIQSL